MTTATLTRRTSLKGKVGAFTVADNPKAIMDILINQYLDKSLAVIREYTNNALDATREAGGTDPVEVTLPTVDSPVLSVRDYGTGMSRDDAVGLYTTFTATTKENSQLTIGHYGIGGKSAFSIAAQFTIDTVKDGLRNIAIFSVDDEFGVSHQLVVENEPTDDRNGTEVKIPIHDIADITRAARAVFMAWQPGTVLVDGKQPDSFFERQSTITVAHDVWVTDRDIEGSPFAILMGNSIYRVNDALAQQVIDSMPEWGSAERSVVQGSNRKANQTFIVRVPNGAAHVTPSRDHLRDSGKTIRAVAGAVGRFLAAMNEYLEQHVAGAATLREAVAAAVPVRESLPSVPMHWGEVELTGTAEILADAPIRSYAYSGDATIQRSADTLMEFSAKNVLNKGVLFVEAEGDRWKSGVVTAARALVRSLAYDRVVLLEPFKQVTSKRLRVGDYEFASVNAPWFTTGEGGSVATITDTQLIARAEPYRKTDREAKAVRYAAVSISPNEDKANSVKVLGDLTLDMIGDLDMPVYLSAHEPSRQATRRSQLISEPILVVYPKGSQRFGTMRRRLPDAKLLTDLYHEHEQLVMKLVTREQAEQSEIRSRFRPNGYHGSVLALALRADEVAHPDVRAVLDRINAARAVDKDEAERVDTLVRENSGILDHYGIDVDNLAGPIEALPLSRALLRPYRYMDDLDELVSHFILYVNALV